MFLSNSRLSVTPSFALERRALLSLISCASKIITSLFSNSEPPAAKVDGANVHSAIIILRIDNFTFYTFLFLPQISKDFAIIFL